MANINIKPAGAVRNVFQTGRATADGAGSGLKALGGSVQDVSRFMVDSAERKANLERQKMVAQDNLHWAERRQELARTLPDGGVGMTAILKQEMEDRGEEQRDQLGTRNAQKSYDLDILNMKSSVLGRAIGVEAAANARGEVRVTKETADLIVNQVATDPSLAEDAIKASDALFVNMKLADDVFKQSMIVAHREAIWDTAAGAMLDPKRVTTADGARGVADMLAEKDWKERLTPEDYQKRVTQANRLVKTYENQEEDAFLISLDENIKETELGLATPDKEYTAQEVIDNVSNPARQKKALQALSDAKRMGVWQRSVNKADVAQLAVMRARLDVARATSGDVDYEERQQIRLKSAEVAAKAAAVKVDNANDKAMLPIIEEQIAYMGTGAVDATYPTDTIEQIADVDLREKLYALADESFNRGNIIIGVNTSDSQQLAQMGAELQANKDEFGDTKQDEKALVDFTTAVKTRNAIWKKDPVAAAATYSSTVRAAQEDYANDPTPENFGAVVNTLRAAQKANGIPDAEIRYLTKPQVAGIEAAKPLLGTDPDMPEKFGDYITGLQTQYGKHWPQVYRQLKTEGTLSGGELVAAGMVGTNKLGTRNALLAALAVSKDDINKTTTSDQRTAAQDEAIAALAPLARTLAHSQGGVTAMADRIEAVKAIVLQASMRDGEDLTKVAEKAAHDIAIGDYDFGATYRIPVAENLSIGAVDGALKRVVRTINVDKLLNIPESNSMRLEDRKASYIRNIQNSGSWITNGDETGLTLVDGNNIPVIGLDRKPLTVTWDDLSIRGTSNLVKKFK